MKNNRQSRSPTKFRPGAGKKKVDDLLNPEVLDDETRRMLLQEVMNPRPANLGGVPPRTDYTSPSLGGAKKHLKQQRSAGVGVDGSVEVTAVKNDYPSQFRSRVSNSSEDLVTIMTARLSALEKKQKVYEMELNELRGKYQKLTDQYKEEKQKRDEAENVVVTLYEEKKDLEEELRDMVQFLSDYGLQWKGREGRRPSGQSAGVAKEKFDLYAGDFTPSTPREDGVEVDTPRSQDSGPVNFNNTAQKGTKLFDAKEIPHSIKENEKRRREGPGEGDKPVDVELLQRNARILSDYVGYKDNYVEGNRGGIRLRDVVKCVVYANGIIVNDGPFRPFGWPLCDAFIKDLEEGFYPYEFKEKYPSGFPIEVTDRSTEEWSSTTAAAPSGGRRLGGNVYTMDSEKERPPMTKENVLQKLPEQRVTADGKIINVREEVAKFIHGNDGDATGVAMTGTVKHVSAVESKYLELKGENPQATDESQKKPMVVEGLISILLRLPNGQKVTLKMDPSSTINDLRDEFAAAVPEYKTKRYELCQAFPSLTFDDHSKTLVSLGLVRSCTLMVRLD